MISKTIDMVEKKYYRKDVPEFRVGDTVDVHVKIVEGNKTRVQIFNGVVIGKKGGGINESFTVRRIVNNEGVERIFLLHSPLVTKLEVKRRGKVRRAKLYYLRDRIGKARRLKELRSAKPKKQGSADKEPTAKARSVEDEPQPVGA